MPATSPQTKKRNSNTQEGPWTFQWHMGARRKVLGLCHRNTWQHSVPQVEENRLPVRYLGTETPLILVRQCTTLPGPTHATSATLIFLQLSKSTPTTGLVHCFPLTLALTAQHSHSAVFPLTVHTGCWMIPISSDFILFREWILLSFYILSFFRSARSHARLHA